MQKRFLQKDFERMKCKRSCLLEPFDQKRHDRLHFIRSENLFGRHFFRKPAERQSLFFAEGKPGEHGREFVRSELYGMSIRNASGSR